MTLYRFYSQKATMFSGDLAALSGKGKAMQVAYLLAWRWSCLQAPLLQCVGCICPVAKGFVQRNPGLKARLGLQHSTGLGLGR